MISRILFLISTLALMPHAKVYYVSPSGNDAAAGTLTAPFKTIAQGQTAANPGDTVYFRGGVYAFVSTTAQIGIALTKSGTQGNPIRYWAFPGESPVFDFYGMTAAQRIKGVNLTASWIHLKGFEMRGVPQTASLKAHEDWCIYVDGGSNNILELLNLHHNMGPGLFIINGGKNLILNCDSHDNWDAYSYTNGSLDAGQNADGFGFHSTNIADSGTVFRGCRAWWNADDGWDFIQAATAVTVENSWSWLNGYKAGTTTASGNGNGFKVGGYGLPPSNVPAKVPQHMVRFCLAFNNRAAGFYQNHHLAPDFFYNNTSYNNAAANFNLLGYKNGDASLGILRNNIAFMGAALSNAMTGTGVDAMNNSWNLTPAPVAGDFLSTDSTGVSGPRKADGSLPNIAFMKLRAGSAMIDKGVNVGYSYTGNSPDLGAFEYGAITGISLNSRQNRAGVLVWHSLDLRGRTYNGTKWKTGLHGTSLLQIQH